MKTALKLLAVALLALTSFQSNAYDFEADGLRYQILSEEDRTVEVSAGSSSPFFIIPAEVISDSKTYTVTAIANRAFSGLPMRSVTMPNTVTSIGIAAFLNCPDLGYVNIPKSVTSIGDNAFRGCESLQGLDVDSENSYFAAVDGILYDKSVSTLLQCPAGKSSVIIPNSVTSIKGSAFADCYRLTSVTISGSVASIGNYAFYNCKLLSSLNIPDSVESIGESAFYNCTGLTSLTIPVSVTSIERSAFRRCSALTSLIIPDSVTSIGGNAFEHCTGLASLIIPNSVTFIGDGAFMYCTGLTSLIIPNSVTSIEGFTFCNCN